MRTFLHGRFSWLWAETGGVAVGELFGYADEVLQLKLG